MTYIILAVVYILGCLALMTIILLQKKQSGGLGSIAGIGNAAETYWDKNKSRSMEGALEKWSKIGGAIFFVFSMLMCFI
ncbi:MAG: preprotein translocase subunit SecG [Defluviitaleaceae bacterium]|nr:preprotein translocase subunit SecG [Defluviitaleaceae bacterium]